MPGPIVILAAIQIEARAIARALGLEVKGRWAWRSVAEISAPVHLQLVGLRAGRLPGGLLIGASCVIMAGVAGGLDPALELGQVILDDVGGFIGAVPPGIQIGRIHTAAEIVCTAADKAALFAQTGARVVDMEMDIVRQAARLAGVPLIGVRAVLDSAACALPTYLSRITDDIGRPRALAMTAQLARSPRTLVDLARLGKQAKIALSALTLALVPLVTQLQERAGKTK